MGWAPGGGRLCTVLVVWHGRVLRPRGGPAAVSVDRLPGEQGGQCCSELAPLLQAGRGGVGVGGSPWNTPWWILTQMLLTGSPEGARLPRPHLRRHLAPPLFLKKMGW